MKCWASRDSIFSLRNCLNTQDLPCRTLCHSRTSIDNRKSYPSLGLHRLSRQDRGCEAVETVVRSWTQTLSAKRLPGRQRRRTVSLLTALAGLAPQPPLPALPIERGDNTLTRTLSGIILGAFGSLCIYSGGLLFTGEDTNAHYHLHSLDFKLHIPS